MNVAEKYTVTDSLIKLVEGLPSLLPKKNKDDALQAFKKQGIPNRKSEEYKYCKLDLILKDEFALQGDNTINKTQLEKIILLKDAFTVVIVNGTYNSELSSLNNLPKGLIVCNIKEAFNTHSEIVKKHFSQYAEINLDPFIALNTAALQGGVFIQVDKNAVVEKPIQIVHISSADKNLITNSHNVIVIEKSAQAKIIEHFVSINSSAKVFNNALNEIVVDENAIVEHYKIQDENTFGNLLSTTQVHQEKQSVFTTNTITLSGAFVRNNLAIVLNGQHIESNLFGLYLTNNNQVVDNHTLVDHQQPNCNSNELYKGIINDESTATFNGKIFVRKDAQKTNAFQSNKNILLSDDGAINTKPQLEIYADDVKCSHGTSTGKLDEEKIFYLRARGLSESSAKKLLMVAFASEVLEKISIEPLKEILEKRLTELFS